MGRRNRFVGDEVVRLPLADVYKRQLDDLVVKGVTVDGGAAAAAAEGLKALGVPAPAEPQDLLGKAARPATAEELEAATRTWQEEAEDGAWVDVKKELTAGEANKAGSKLIKELHFGERPVVDPEQIRLAKVLAYVVAWSLCDEDGRPIPFSASAIDHVNTRTFAEIAAAVDHHEEQAQAALEARKNAMAGATRS